MSFERLDSLKDQVAVITGGAGQVGYATAIRLANAGARVIALVRRDLPSAQEKMDQLKDAAKLKHFAILASVIDGDSLRLAVKEVETRAGRCDILVNSAGINKNIEPSDLNALTDELFDTIVQTNLRGVFATIREFAPLLKASTNGLIVNVSSAASLRSGSSNIAYSASKAGINVMTQVLGRALAPEIRVVTVTPGILEKPVSGAVKNHELMEKKIVMSIPLRRIGMADDIASTIEACATHMRFATGTNFIIDGGRTI